MYTRKTKIVCTLGPSSDSVSEMENLVSAGMNVARLNFSHGTYEHHSKMVKNLHKVEKTMGKRIAILQDLQGPKIRIGKMPDEGITIKRGEHITLTIKSVIGKRSGKSVVIPIQYKNIVKDLKKNDILYIDDGLIELIVLKKSKDALHCKVKVGGLIKKHKGVNCPTASISAKAITPKDKKDLMWGLKNNVDYIALSFVKSPRDILELKRLIKSKRKNTKVIAKIERHEAVKNLKQIMKVVDGVMVARGDLGIEIPAEQVPIVQKRMIHLANRYGKPVITATQVLQSMVENARATRAEISDAANAVFDHTDAIMLSNESAVGRFPFRAARTLKKVAITIEQELSKDKELLEYIASPTALSSLNAACLNACELAQDSGADFIIVYTDDGYTARHIAKHRTYIPIITITPNEKTARELCLIWGLNKVFTKKIPGKTGTRAKKLISFLKKKKVLKKGHKVVTVESTSKKEKNISNFKL